MCLPPVSCIFVVFLQPYCSWGPLLAWRTTFEDCIKEKPTHRGPARRLNLDQNAILKVKNNGTAYANPELGTEIKWKILARQKAGIWLHAHSIVWRRLTTKDSERLRQKNVSGKMKRNGARDKRMRAWLQGNRCAEQTRVAGEGLELLQGTRKVNRKTKETAARNKTRPLEKARNKCAGQEEVSRKTKVSAAQTKRSRWRRPGTSARNNKESAERQGTPPSIQKKSF